jgi:glutamate-1-semialdehyde aminotransferase
MELAVELAERLCRLIPGAQRVWLAPSSAAVRAAALTAARAFTGRELVLASSDDSCPLDSGSLHARLAAAPGRFAAVLVRPAPEQALASGELASLQELACRHGALLIVDETEANIRAYLDGSQRNASPADLTCLGRALGNGYPIVGLAGRADVLECASLPCSETPTPAALAAALAVLNSVDRYTQADGTGKLVQEGFNAMARRAGLAGRLSCRGDGGRFRLVFVDEDDPLQPLLLRELLGRGLFTRGLLQLSPAHGAVELEQTLVAFAASLKTLSLADRAGRGSA